MCLAAPARVISITGDEAVVDLDGVRLTVSTVLTPEITVDDVALVHVGFILSRIDPEEADAAQAALRRIAVEALS
jgi:hydrogenase expression/formation protein HypC